VLVTNGSGCGSGRPKNTLAKKPFFSIFVLSYKEVYPSKEVETKLKANPQKNNLDLSLFGPLFLSADKMVKGWMGWEINVCYSEARFLSAHISPIM
jgi:hypothetical protein